MPLIRDVLGVQQDDEPTFGREFRNAVPRGLGQMVQGVGQLAEDFGWDDNFVKEYGQRVIERNPTQINSLEDIADHPLAALGSATGNALSFLGPQLGVGLLGKGAAAYGLARTGAALQGMGAQAAVAGLPSYGGIREQQIEEGHDLLSDKLVAGAGAATVGLIENLGGAQRLLGIGRPGSTIRDTIKDQFGATPWRTAGRVLGKSTLQEGAEELAQNPIEQMAAYHDPRTAENIQETLFGGAMGALGGLGMGGAIAPYRGLQHRGLRDELRADQFIDPTAQAPTDLLRGLDAVDQLADMDQRIGSYGDYRYLQALHDQGQSEALRMYQEEQARRQEIERARAATPSVDQFHTDLDYQNRWRESQMPYGYGEIDPTLEIPTAPPRYAADVDPNLPAPGRPTVASAASGGVEQAEPKPVEPSKETQRLVAALTEYQAAGQITPEEYDTAVGQLMAAEAKVQAAPRGTKKAIRKSVLAPVHKATGAFIQSKFKGATDANGKSVRKGRAVKGVQAKDVPGAQTQVGASAESTQGTGVQTTQTNQGEVNGTQTTETALSEVRQETRQGPALPGEQVAPDDIQDETHAEGVRMHLAGESSRAIAEALGGSHTLWNNKILPSYGYTFKGKEAAEAAQAETGSAFTADTQANAAPDEDTAADATPDQITNEQDRSAGADAYTGDEVVDHALESGGVVIRGSKDSGAAVLAVTDKQAVSELKKAIAALAAPVRKRAVEQSKALGLDLGSLPIPAQMVVYNAANEGRDVVKADVAKAVAVQEALKAKQKEDKLAAQRKAEAANQQLSKDVSSFNGLMERVLLGDLDAARDMVVLLTGPNGSRLMLHLRDNMGMPKSLDTPMKVVGYLVDMTKGQRKRAASEATSQQTQQTFAVEAGALIEGEFEQVTDEEVAQATNLLPNMQAAVETILTDEEKAEVTNHYDIEDTFGTQTKKAFLNQYAKWLHSGGKMAHQLVHLFQKLAKSVVNGALAIAVAFNFNVSVPEAQASVPVTKYAVTQVTERPKADFSGVAAPVSVQLVADWQARSQHGKPFIVAHKAGGALYAFDAKGKLIGKAPALYAKGMGDVVSAESAAKSADEMTDADKITPAGAFAGTKIESDSYGSAIQFVEQEKAVIAIHRVYLGNPKENRQGRLDSATPADNRVSYGCINVPSQFFDGVLAPNFTGDSRVIVMPENDNVAQFFPMMGKGTVDKVTQMESGGKTDSARAASWGSDHYGIPEKRRADQRNASKSGRNPKGGTRFSESEKPKKPTSVRMIDRVIDALFMSPARKNQLIRVYATQAEAHAALGDAAFSQTASRKKGFTLPADAAKSLGHPPVGLIAENIPEGQELSIVLHELGVHLGMEGLVGAENMKWLADRIEAWRQRNDGSVESRVARWAYEKALDSSSENRQEELIAYMVEGLVNEGVNPQAAGQTEAHQWFRKLWAAAKAALRRLGFKNPTFSGQNLVDLAYGAADLELQGAWHGTAAEFRNFNHDYMGAGEGAQAFGWGTYLAQRVGVAKGYWKQDVERKTGVDVNNTALRRVLNKEEIAVMQKYALAAKPGVISNNHDLIAYLEKRAADTVWRVPEADKKTIGDIVRKMRPLLTKPTGTPEGSLMRAAMNIRDEEFLDLDSKVPQAQTDAVLDGLRTLIKQQGVSSGPLLQAGRFIENNQHKLSGAGLYRAVMRAFGAPKETKMGVGPWNKQASEFLDSVGIKGNKFLDQPSRRPQIVDRFLNSLDVQADPEEVMAVVTDKASYFTTEDRALLTALNNDDWLGFDYPAQALNQVLNKGLDGYDASPELVKALDVVKNLAGKTHNLVIFNDKNVQRVSTQVGARRDSGSIKFSESVVRELGRTLQINSGSVWDRLKPKLLTTHQLVDQFGDKLKSLKEYVNATDAMDQFQKKLAVDAHPIMLKWQAIPAAVRKQLHSIMLDATTWEIHPDLPMTDPLNKQVTDATKYNALKSRYEALPADAKQTYKDARDMFKKLWDMRGTEFDKLVDASYAKLIANDPDNKAKLEAKRDSIKEDHSKQLKSIQGPYFPLLRFGDFITMGMSDEFVKVKESLDELTGKELTDARKKLDAMKKDPKHYVVYASETKAAATAKARQVEALGLNSHMQLVDEKFSALSPLNANGLEQLRNLFSNEFGKADANKIGELLTEVYINSLPEHSALQRQLKRVGVTGAEENMLRVFAQAVERDSFHISRMKFQDAISEQLFKMKQEANASGTEFGHVYNNVRARMNMDFQYQRTPVISMINRLSSFWHLGVSPAYLLTNATQPWMITMPVLSGRFKKNAMPYMTRGWNDAKKMIVVSKKNGAFADINFDTLADKNERDMLQQVRDLGQIDITINFDIGNVADDVNPRWLKLQKVLSFANHHIEVSNRITTALAAYRMAKDAKMSHEAAVDAAYKAVVNTQLDYSDTNAAYFMKGGHFGGLNKMVMQFRKYQQGMLYLIAQNTKLAFQGDKDAMRSLGYLMAMQGAFAGAAGIPFLTAAMFVAGLGFGGGDDKDGDLETQLRNWLADTIGADAARVFWKGLPAMFGIDVSKRVGMGDMWNPMPFLRMGGEKTGQEKLGKVAVALGGAPVGTLANFMDAAMLAQEGQLARASEKLLPKMLADPIKATRYGDEGLMTRKGTPVMGNRAFSAGDLAQQALGFTPLKITEHYDAANAKENTARAIKERRENLIAQWAKYKIKNDAAEVKSMDEAIYNWNVKHPDKGQRIDRSSLIKAANNRKKAAKETNAAGVRYQKSESGLKGIDRFAAGA